MGARTILLVAVSGLTVLATGACGNGPAAPSAAAYPAPLSSAWYSTGAPAASVAPAQVAPGAYHP
jgi:hypothetical protein